LQVVAGVASFVGVSCSPMSVVSTGSGAKCKQQPMCCGNNKMVSCEQFFLSYTSLTGG